MLTSLLDRLERWATRRNILVLLAIFVLINAGLMPVLGARIETLSGGVGPLDLRGAYTPAEAYAAMAAYGDEGRQLYRLIELTIDLIYPLVYGLFFSLTIIYCLRPVLAKTHTLRRTALLPLVGMLADLVENAGIAVMLLNYPNRTDGLAAFTSTVTTIKWIFAILAMVATAAALIALVVQRVRSRGAQPTGFVRKTRFAQSTRNTLARRPTPARCQEATMLRRDRCLIVMSALVAAVLACGPAGTRAPSVADRATRLAQTAAVLLTSTAAARITPASPTPLPNTTPQPTLTATATATVVPDTPSASISPAPCENDSEFVSDVNVPDGTHFAPGTEFVKAWRLRNDGVCTWTTA